MGEGVGNAREALIQQRSDPVLVDNTAPLIEYKVEHGDRQVTIKVQVLDALSPIENVQYAVDAPDEWEPALPGDLIFDSTRETLAITIPDLTPGPHVITLRAADTRGNARYEAVLLNVK